MDRSFLTKQEVVAASRDFVCIRLSTYEDKQEADFLKSIFVGRSGELENTTFVILAPDGRRRLTAAGRGPFFEYRNSQQMAQGMKSIAKKVSSKVKSEDHSQLPLMKSLELALNVAACDNLPLIVTLAESNEEQERMQDQLLDLAWSDSLGGQFIYVAVSDKADLKPLTGIEGENRILVVEPDAFGLSGKVVKQFKRDDKRQAMASAMDKIVADFPRKSKEHGSHVRLGLQLGIDWESVIPETDPMSIQARERARGRR